MTEQNDAVKANENVTDAVKELAAMAWGERRSDARKAHADVTEAVQELLTIIEEQKAEIKRLRAEREEAERTILRLESQYGVAVKDRDEARKTCCRLWQKEDSGYITVQRLAEDQGWNCFTNDSNA